MIYWRDIRLGLPVTWGTAGIRGRITATNPAYQTVTVQLTQDFTDYASGTTTPRGHTVHNIPHTSLRIVA